MKATISKEVIDGSRQTAANIYRVDEDLMSDLRILYRKYGVKLMARATRQLRLEFRIQRNARTLSKGD